MDSGIVIINKEKGYTSQNVVSKVKKILNVKKAGHIGTLDPLATGVLPILIGNGTKLSKYLIEHDKTYIAEIQLGIQKDTGDEEGKVIKTCDVKNINIDKINSVLQSFKGKQKQAPHKFSAVKINGKKLYEYARNGEEVDIPSRDIEIYSIELLNFDEFSKIITFKVKCSKGTYIRVLCEDIATKLDTVGYMSNLKRISVDKFCLKDAVTLDELSCKDIISAEDLCIDFPKIDLDNRKVELFLNGVMLTFHENEGIYRIYNSQKFIGLRNNKK